MRGPRFESLFFLTALQGSIIVDAPVNLHGYCDIDALARNQLVVSAPIHCHAGFDSSGLTFLQSHGDVSISSDLGVSSTDGGGLGDLVVAAGGSITLGSDDAGVGVDIGADGSKGFFGDAGTIEFRAAGDLTMGSNVLIHGNTRNPAAFGGEIYLTALGTVNVRGRMEARGIASKISVQGNGDVTIGAGAAMTTETGRARSPSFVDIRSHHGNVTIGGDIALSGGSVTDDTTAGVLIRGCDVTLVEGATVTNTIREGRTRIAAREQTSILTGVEMATYAGSNEIFYRAKPPLIEGVVAPEPLLSQDASLPACAP